MPVLCGIDFTPTSDATVDTAAALADTLGEPLVLAHALGELPYLVEGAIRGHLAYAARQRLEEVAGRLPARALRPLRVEVLPGGAHRALLALARDERASVLVVGWRGHGDGLQGAPGGVAERCALRAPVPVLVARDAAPFQDWAAGRRPLRIAVAVDPSRPSSSMTAWLGRLRAAAPCDVVAAHVRGATGVEPRHEAEVGAPSAASTAAGATLLAELIACLGPLPGSGRVTAAVQLGASHVAEALVGLARAHEADLLLVGAPRAVRPWSVAAGAVHLARMAVATVPRDAPEEPRAA